MDSHVEFDLHLISTRRSDYHLLIARVSEGRGRVEQPLQAAGSCALEPEPGNLIIQCGDGDMSSSKCRPLFRRTVDESNSRCKRGVADPHDLRNTSAGTPGPWPTSAAVMTLYWTRRSLRGRSPDAVLVGEGSASVRRRTVSWRRDIISTPPPATPCFSSSAPELPGIVSARSCLEDFPLRMRVFVSGGSLPSRASSRYSSKDDVEPSAELPFTDAIR